MKKTTTIATLLIIFLTLATFSVQAQLVITATSPAQNEMNVLRNANIDFATQGFGIINPNTVNSSTFIVTGSQTGLFSGTYSGVGGSTETYIFNPSTDFKAGETITVTLTTGIQNFAGDSFSAPYTYSFMADVNPALEAPAFFEASTIEDTGDRAEGLYVVDVDDDGDMDVLASFLDEATYNDAPYSVTWYENNGSQSFVVRSITNSATAPLRAHDVHAGDMDGDGDVDILSADDNGVYWYESDGNANPGFTDHEISGAEGGARDIYVADVDGDGDMDVLRAFYNDSTIAWYENDGNGNPGFTYHVIYASANSARSVHASDVDGDGDMDVLSASENDDDIAWYENNGNSAAPGFTHHIIHNGFGGHNTRKVYSGDVDGDLDMDVLFGHGSTLDWLENTGSGSFGSPQNITSSANTIVDISMSDVDGDGDMDVLSASLNDNKIAWYENNGNTNPSFNTHNITTLATNAAAVYAADLDGDLDMDVLSGTSFGDGKVTWYENKAVPPVITIVTPTPNSIGNPVNTDITLVFDHPIDNATLNNSTIIVRGTRTGLIGGALSGGGTNTITFNPTTDFEVGERITVTLTTGLLSTDGLAMDAPYAFSFLAAVASPPESPPVFYPEAISTTADGARDVYAADLDGDGDMDVLSASENDDSIAWYENKGSGYFDTENNITSTADGAYAIYATDVDSDGDMDVLSASKNDDTIAWYANNGSGSFGAEQIISTTADGAHDVYAIDNDGDGDMDVVSASENDDDITLYKNDGNQSFSVDLIENFATEAHSVYAADIDGDRDMDLLSAWGNSSGGGIDWYENGGFDYSYSVQSGQSVFAGDMDGDGDMDMLLASEFKIYWHENDGQLDPGFTHHEIDSFGSGRSVYATDMDGDGDLDVLLAKGNTVVWYENDGNGNFSAEKTITSTANVANSVFAADMDGDGDMDVLSASTNDDTIAWYESDDTVLTLYVDGSGGSDSNTGESWGQAFKTLTKALSEADERNQIWIAQGTYYPDEGFGATNDDRNSNFTVTGVQDGVEIYGGFAGTETQLDQRDPGAHPVILNGDIDGDGTATGNSYHVLYLDGTTGGGITSETVLDGFTITSGNAEGTSPDNRGGGIYLVGNGFESVCSPHLANIVFADNSAVAGGAIYCFGYKGNSSPVIMNSVFIGNTASSIGGALQTNGNRGGTSSPVVVNSIFISNHSNGDGGGIHNSAVQSGTSATQISNSIFWGNTATGSGDQIYNNDADPTLSNTIIEGGLAGISNNGSSGTTDGGGNLSTNPQFVNIGDPDGADNIFGTDDDGLFLQSTSPVINAGDNSLYEAADGDNTNNSLQNDLVLSGTPRLIGPTIDMGAYESSLGADYIYENGSWMPSNPSGVATTSNDILVINGTTVLTADTQMNDLIINPGAILKIEQALMPNGEIINNGNIIFVNDATRLGQLDDMTGSTITGSGEVIVQRYIPKRNDSKGAWRYLTSAVNSSGSIHANWQEGATGINDDPNPNFGMFITGSTTGADGFDQTASGAPSMYTFDEATQSYVFVPNTDVANLVAGQDYVAYVWGDRSVDIITTNDPPATTTTLQATGNLVTGNQSFAGSSVAGEFNLTGNPYQAIVDMNAVLANSTNLNPNIYYVWDPNLGTRGAYATVDLAGASTLPSTSEANQCLQPGQAAWTVTAAAGAATVLFEESDKDVLQTPTDVFRPQNVASIELQLFQQGFFANNGPLSEAVRVNFSKGESNAVLPNDAPKLWNYDETIALVNGNEYLAIGNRALPTNGETLQLHNDQYRVSDYVFKALVNGFAENVTVSLKDDYLGIQTPLNHNRPTLINFSVDQSIPASIAPDRFSLVFVVNGLSTDDFADEGFTLYPNPTKDGEFFILTSGLAGEAVQVNFYDLLGQRVYRTEKEVGDNGRIRVKAHNLQAGVYMLKMTCNGKSFVGRMILE